MDLKFIILIIFLLCLIDLSLQGCEYEEAQRLQQNYKRCVDDSSKESFTVFHCSYLTEVSFRNMYFLKRSKFSHSFQIFDKCNPLLESCFTKKQVEEMTSSQMKAFNEIMKIGNLDLSQCKSESSSSMNLINFPALLLIIQLLVQNG